MRSIPVLAWLVLVLVAPLGLAACGGGGAAAAPEVAVIDAPPDPVRLPPVVPPVVPPVEPLPAPPEPPLDPLPEPPPVDPPADPPVDPPVDPVPPPGPPALLGFGDALDVAFDPVERVFYAVDPVANQLLRRGELERANRFVADVEVGPVIALAFRPAPARLYALVGDVAGPQAIVEIDPVNGSLVAGVAVDAGLRLAALEWHEADQVLYAADEASDAIVALDPVSGAALSAALLDVDMLVRALAVEPVSGDLIALDVLGRRLVAIDRASGAPGAELLLDRLDLVGLAEVDGRFAALDHDDGLMLLYDRPGSL